MNDIDNIPVQCPYCGETVELPVDCSIEHQEYIEDCSVCCQPISVSVRCEGEGRPLVAVRRDDD